MLTEDETTIKVQYVTHHRFTVDEYYKLVEIGVLKEDERVELIEGQILELEPQSPRHASCVDRFNHHLQIKLDHRAILSVHNPVRFDQFNEPEPDAMLLKWQDDFYASGHPGSGDVLLLIEVSDNTLRYDRDVKLPIYARVGIPEVWIIDLHSGQLEVFTLPSSEGYTSSRILNSGDSVSPSAFADISLAVDDIIP